jgi:hypothetical protein
MRWCWCLFVVTALCVTFAARAATPPAAPAVEAAWESYDEEGGCIGGSRCGDQGDSLRIPLEDAAVWGVRFHAGDDVGETRAGRLRVRIDNTPIAPEIDVADAGQLYELPVEGRRGRFLIVETRADDEVVVEDIEIRYAGLRAPRAHRQWKSYPEESGCIGGDRCRDQGRLIRVPLEASPVWGIRFRANDDVGPRTRAHLRVRIDHHALARDLDVAKTGESYDLMVPGLRGRYLIFEAIANDEVVVEDIAVQYSGLRDPLETRKK